MTDRPVLRHQPDVSRGAWISGRLGDWSTIASVVPQGFEAYARIFHPVDAQLLAWHDDLPVTVEERRFRWRDIAAVHGTVSHPLMQWQAILAGYKDPRWGEGGWQYGGPEQGRLPVEEVAAVAKILARHATTPDACVASLWEGYGWIHGGGAVVTLTATSWDVYSAVDDEDEPAAVVAGGGDPATAEPSLPAPPPTPAGLGDEVRNGPRLELPNRSYYLFDTALQTFEDPDWAERAGWDPMWPQSPNQLWPADRAWFLASEIDFDSTIVAGPAALITELVRSEELEAMEIPAGASLTEFADTINGLPGPSSPAKRGIGGSTSVRGAVGRATSMCRTLYQRAVRGRR